MAPMGNPRTVNPGAGAQRPGMNVPRPDLGPGVVMGGGPAPIQRPGVGPAPRPVIGPPPKPLPTLPYGGPIAMPGGNPSVPIGGQGPVYNPLQGPMPIAYPGGNMNGQLPQGPAPLPTNGQGSGKSMPGGNPGGPMGGPVDMNGNMQMPGQQLPPGVSMGFGFDPNTGGPLGSQPMPMSFGQAGGGMMGAIPQPLPNFANVLGTVSPLFNTLRR